MPFDPTREFDHCVMCGGLPPFLPNGMSREHLFGDSLARLMGTIQKPVPWSATIATTSGFKNLQGGQPMLSAVSVCLCRCCNTNFSDMMGRAQPLIFELAKGASRTIGVDEQLVMLRYFERLGYLVDVLCSNFEITDKFANSRHNKSARWRRSPPVYTPEQRNAWLLGVRDGSEPKIYVGNHRGVLGLNPTTSADVVYDRSLVTAIQRRFHTVIGCLAIELQMGAGVEGYLPPQPYVQIANPPTSMSWPPASNVNYTDFYALHEQSLQVREQLAFLAHPIRRMAHEAHIRRMTAL